MIRISIGGMSCQHCVHHVTQALSGLKGVTQVEVSLEKGEANVQATAELSDALIRKTLDEEGYEVTAIARA